LDSHEVAATDSFLNEIGVTLDTVNGDNINFNLADLESFRDTRDLRQGLNKYAVILEEKLEKEEDVEKKAKLREYIRLCRSPEQAVAQMLEYMSWAFFLLLPIFAVFLKLVYIRRKQNYMRHLIFSIHIHSFIFLLLTLIVGLYMVYKGNLRLLTTVLFLFIPVYFIIALKKFYGQSFGKVFLKFLTVSFLYNTVFWLVVGFVFLNALSII